MPRVLYTALLLGGCAFAPTGLTDENWSVKEDRDLAVTAPDLAGEDLTGADLAGADLTQTPSPDLAQQAPDMTVPPDMTIVCGNGMAPRHIGEVSEGDAARWSAVAAGGSGGAGSTYTATTDTTVKAVGANSIRLNTNSSGAALSYPKGGNAGWNLSGFTEATIRVAGDPNFRGWQNGMPEFWLITNFQGQDWYHYTQNASLVPTNTNFATITIPLAGGNGWTRNTSGMPSLANVSYLSIHFESEDSGFQAWVDGVTFGPGTFVDCSP